MLEPAAGCNEALPKPERLIIYAARGCSRCARALALARAAGLPVEERDARELTSYHEGWREDGTVGRLAVLAWKNMRLPVVAWTDDALAEQGRALAAAADEEACGGDACTLDGACDARA